MRMRAWPPLAAAPKISAICRASPPGGGSSRIPLPGPTIFPIFSVRCYTRNWGVDHQARARRDREKSGLAFGKLREQIERDEDRLPAYRVTADVPETLLAVKALVRTGGGEMDETDRFCG